MSTPVHKGTVAQGKVEMFTKSFTKSDSSLAGADKMSALNECSAMFREIAGDQPVRGGRVKAALRKIQSALPGWTASRIRTVWYADERATVTGDELREVERAARRAANRKAAKDDFAILQARIDRLEALLVREEQGSADPSAEAIRDMAGERSAPAGTLDRAMGR